MPCGAGTESTGTGRDRKCGGRPAGAEPCSAAAGGSGSRNNSWTAKQKIRSAPAQKPHFGGGSLRGNYCAGSEPGQYAKKKPCPGAGL